MQNKDDELEGGREKNTHRQFFVMKEEKNKMRINLRGKMRGEKMREEEKFRDHNIFLLLSHPCSLTASHQIISIIIYETS